MGTSGRATHPAATDCLPIWLPMDPAIRLRRVRARARSLPALRSRSIAPSTGVSSSTRFVPASITTWCAKNGGTAAQQQAKRTDRGSTVPSHALACPTLHMPALQHGTLRMARLLRSCKISRVPAPSSNQAEVVLLKPKRRQADDSSRSSPSPGAGGKPTPVSTVAERARAAGCEGGWGGGVAPLCRTISAEGRMKMP